MGVILHKADLITEDIRNLRPIVYTVMDDSMSQASVSINNLLAEKLARYNTPQKRALKMKSLLLSILQPLPDDVLMTDIDVMFNPNYPLDALNILIETCRAKPFQLLWPGSYENGYLIYSLPELSDYKTYKVENYDIAVII